MKRSEVIDLLDTLLWNSENLDVPYVGPKGFLPLANEILNELEELGMLPPPVPKLNTERFSVNNVEFYGSIVEVNEWDEE